MAAALAVVNGVVLLTDECRQGNFTCVQVQLFKPNLRREGETRGAEEASGCWGGLSVVWRGWNSQARSKMSQFQSHDAEKDVRSCRRHSLHGASHPLFFFFFFLTQGFELRLEILGSRKMGSHFDT